MNVSVLPLSCPPAAAGLAVALSAGLLLAVMPDGQFYLGGLVVQTIALGPDTLTSDGREGLFVAKFDAAGTPLWARQAQRLLPETYYDGPEALAVDPAGNVWMRGFALGVPPFGAQAVAAGSSQWVTFTRATNATFTLGHAQPANAGVYSVIVSGPRGGTTSSEVHLTVLPAPAGPGSVDTTFDLTAGGQRVGLEHNYAVVRAVVLQPDGKMLIGGGFVGVDGLPRQNIARLNPDGTTDVTFNPSGTDEEISAIALQPDGKVVLGGRFTSVNSQRRNCLARLHPDGSLDQAFVPLLPPSAFVYVNSLLVQPDGKILVGYNSWASEDDEHPQGQLVRFDSDGTADDAFHPPAPPVMDWRALNDLALQPDGRILVGCSAPPGFRALERLHPDGSLDTSFHPAMGEDGGAVEHMALHPDGRIVIIGGFVVEVPGGQRVYSTLAQLQPDGSADTSFAATNGTYGVKTARLQPDGKILIGGYFERVGRTNIAGIARYNTNGTLDPSFEPDPQALGQYPEVATLALLPNGRIVAGRFRDYRNPEDRACVFRLHQDGTVDTSFNAAINLDGVYVEAVLPLPNGQTIMGGAFDRVQGIPRRGVARLNPDGTLDAAFDPGADLGVVSQILTLARQPDGKILVGGEFYQTNRPAPNNLARLNPDGTQDESFHCDPRFAGIVRCLALQPDGRILVGGEVGISGTGMSGVVRLTPEGSADTTFDRGTGFWGHDLLIYCLALQPDGKILVGGEFESYNGVPLQGLVRLNPDGSLDSAFQTTNRPFLGTDLVVQPDGKILVAVEESDTNYVVRLNPDGTPDPSFKVVADALGPMVLQGDGRILLRSATGLARLNPDGTRDPAFVAEVVPSFVFALGMRGNSQIMVGGYFHSINGILCHGIARLNNDVVIPGPFVRREIAEGVEIRLSATPAAEVNVYAVEDQPPAGWPVLGISHNGVFDPATGKVKFGPFYDAEPRTLSYGVETPVWGIHSALGVFCFAGWASADGINSPIVGHECMVLAGYFPADVNPANQRMSIEEVTAYGAAWRQGATWPEQPQVIPIDYVTRAAALWRAGECYRVDFLITNEPLWWVPCPAGAGGSSPPEGPARLAGAGATERQLPSVFVPGESLTVTITARPAAGATAYAVEDALPAGWTVAEISQEGELDAVHGQVKWGPFLDNAPRVLTYRVTAPPTAGGTVAWHGVGSFDGVSETTSGTDQVQGTARLSVSYPGSGAQLVLSLVGPVNGLFLIETSTDLVQWTPLLEITTSAGPVQVPLPVNAGEPARFYRARLIP